MRHNKPQRMVRNDSRMLSTTVTSQCQTLCERETAPIPLAVPRMRSSPRVYTLVLFMYFLCFLCFLYICSVFLVVFSWSEERRVLCLCDTLSRHVR